MAFQCPTPQQADALDQVLIDLRARPGVIGVLLCGSMARGTARADSDIDLLVVLGAGTSGFDLHEVGGQVEIEQTRRTVTGWTEQFSPTRPGDESWGYAFLDGVILYDPEGAVARLVATAVEAHAAYRVPPAVRAHYLVLWRHVRPKMEAVLAGGNAIEIGWTAAVMMNQVVETLWAINDLPLPSRDIGCLHRHLPDLTVPDNAQALVEAMLTSSPRTALRIQLQLLEAAQIALVKAGISGVENGQAELGES